MRRSFRACTAIRVFWPPRARLHNAGRLPGRGIPARTPGSEAAAIRIGSTRLSLRLLMLGGTGAMGPYLVRAAVARGHRVAVFSRGKRQAELPDAVERLTGDRNGDLGAIRG